MTNTELVPIEPRIPGFCNRIDECLLRGTSWVFKPHYFSPLKG